MEPEVDTGIFLSALYLIFKMGSLTELGAHHVCFSNTGKLAGQVPHPNLAIPDAHHPSRL